MDFQWHLQWLEIFLALSEQDPAIIAGEDDIDPHEILKRMRDGDLDAFLQVLQHSDERIRIHGVYTLTAFLKLCSPLQQQGYLMAMQTISPSRYLPAFQTLRQKWEGKAFSWTRLERNPSPGYLCWMSIEGFWILHLLPCIP